MIGEKNAIMSTSLIWGIIWKELFPLKWLHIQINNQFQPLMSFRDITRRLFLQLACLFLKVFSRSRYHGPNWTFKGDMLLFFFVFVYCIIWFWRVKSVSVKMSIGILFNQKRRSSSIGRKRRACSLSSIFQIKLRIIN